MKNLLGKFLRDEGGAAAIEYALIVSLIGVGVITALQDLGQTLARIFMDVSRALDTVTAGMR